MEIITFEQIYDIVRKEKSSDELQPLNPQIYHQLRNYLITKEKIINDSAGKVIETEIEKQKIQLNSAKALAKEFFERRERKIVLLALSKSKMADLDLSKLMDSEKELVIKAAKLIENHREENLSIMFGADESPKQASVKSKEIEKVITEPKEPKKEESSEPKSTLSEDYNKTNANNDDGKYKNLETVKFITEQHKFYGPNIEIYGPFKEGDIANLPTIIVDILVNKKKAIRVL